MRLAFALSWWHDGRRESDLENKEAAMARPSRNSKHARDGIDLEALVAQARHSADAAREAARDARDWAEPRYEAARDWAVPRAKHAYRAGARRATPIVEVAGGRAEHLADIVHDAVVGSVIPGVIGAVRRAGREPDPEPAERDFPWLAVIIPLTVAVAAGVAVVAWARRDPGPESWPERDEDWEFADEQRARIARARTSINKAVDSAEEALRHAGEVVASTASAAGAAIAEAAVPTARKVRDAAVPAAQWVRDESGPAAKRVRETVRTARKRATGDVVSAMDDVEDVWGDDETSEIAKFKPAQKSGTGTKPAAKKTAGDASS
jgi:hypothetical protein